MSLVGCSSKDKNEANLEPSDGNKTAQVVEIEDENDSVISRVRVQEKRKEIAGDWAFMELVETDNPWIYVRDVSLFEEFSAHNEGGAVYDADSQTVRVGFTRADNFSESADKPVEGAYVFVEIDLKTGEILQKESHSAPETLGGESIEITDERLVEVGRYFVEIIEKNRMESVNK